MRIAIAVSNLEQVEPTWTTVLLAHEALVRGHSVAFLEPRDLEVTARGRLFGRASALEPPSPGAEALAAMLAARQAPRRYLDLVRFDRVFLRVNPLSEHMLNLALMLVEHGVPVLNDPAGMARTRSKAWLATLSDVPRPITLLTGSPASASLFARNLGSPVIIKPAVSSGGRGVALLSSGQLDRLEQAFAAAQAVAPGPVVVQAYLEAAELGEKRLVWVDGRIVGGYLRSRPPGEFRHNLRLGGVPAPCPISPAERELGALLTPHLVRNGVRIAGLDVIGERVVEVNTVNPGGLHYAQLFSPTAADGGGLARAVLDQLLCPAPQPIVTQPMSEARPA